MVQIEESNPSFESCSDCIYSDDGEETCILRRCIHAVAQLRECYVPKQRKKGMWLPDNNSPYEMRFVCSECKESQVVPTIGFTKYKPIWDFCPYCGARMEGVNDEHHREGHEDA